MSDRSDCHVIALRSTAERSVDDLEGILETVDDRVSVETVASLVELRDRLQELDPGAVAIDGVDGEVGSIVEAVRESHPTVPVVSMESPPPDWLVPVLNDRSTAIVLGIDGERSTDGSRIPEWLQPATTLAPGEDPDDRAPGHFEALVEYSSDIVTVLSPDGTMEYQSPSIRRILGYDPDDLIGDSALQYIHPDDRDRIADRIRAVLENPDDPLEVEYRFRHADGEWRVLESIGRNELETPHIEGIVANSRDVTERKNRLERLSVLPKVARDLQGAEDAETVAEITVETIGTVLDLPIAGVWCYDAATEQLEPEAHTTAAEELFGEIPTFRAKDESLSWEVFESRQYRVYEDVTSTSAVYNPDTPIRSEMIIPLGPYGVLNVGGTNAENFSDVDVHFARILAALATSGLRRVFHVETLERQALELEERNERLDRFASVVSHDLRSPLGVAQAYLEEIARQRADDAGMVDDAADEAVASPVDAIDRLSDSLDRMEAIIEELRELARQGEAIGDREEVSLDTAVTMAWGTVETGDTALDVDAAVRLQADRGRLVELLENCFRNAIEHGDASRIEVHQIERDGEPVGFSVVDDGSGIPEEHRSMVFETGFSTADDGTGLGLAIVEEIATGHGWHVTAGASEEGGARFDVTGIESMEPTEGR